MTSDLRETRGTFLGGVLSVATPAYLGGTPPKASIVPQPNALSVRHVYIFRAFQLSHYRQCIVAKKSAMMEVRFNTSLITVNRAILRLNAEPLLTVAPCDSWTLDGDRYEEPVVS